MSDTPKRSDDQDQEDDSVPIGRLAAWSVLAALLAIGLVVYFRFQPGIAPLYDKVH